MVVRMERQGRKDIVDRESISDQRRVDKREKELRNDLGVFSCGDWEDNGPTIKGVGEKKKEGDLAKEPRAT